jgi:hypothetical protein
MNKIKTFATKTVSTINRASNKKILVWSIVLLFVPFVGGYLLSGLIDLSYSVSMLAINTSGWLSNVIALASWPIDRVVDVMLTPLADFITIACFPLAAILGAMVLAKTKGQNLPALFTTSMGLVFLCGFIFIK